MDGGWHLLCITFLTDRSRPTDTAAHTYFCSLCPSFEQVVEAVQGGLEQDGGAFERARILFECMLTLEAKGIKNRPYKTLREGKERSSVLLRDYKQGRWDSSVVLPRASPAPAVSDGVPFLYEVLYLDPTTLTIKVYVGVRVGCAHPALFFNPASSSVAEKAPSYWTSSGTDHAAMGSLIGIPISMAVIREYRPGSVPLLADCTKTKSHVTSPPAIDTACPMDVDVATADQNDRGCDDRAASGADDPDADDPDADYSDADYSDADYSDADDPDADYSDADYSDSDDPDADDPDADDPDADDSDVSNALALAPLAATAAADECFVLRSLTGHPRLANRHNGEFPISLLLTPAEHLVRRVVTALVQDAPVPGLQFRGGLIVANRHIRDKNHMLFAWRPLRTHENPNTAEAYNARVEDYSRVLSEAVVVKHIIDAALEDFNEVADRSADAVRSTALEKLVPGAVGLCVKDIRALQTGARLSGASGSTESIASGFLASLSDKLADRANLPKWASVALEASTEDLSTFMATIVVAVGPGWGKTGYVGVSQKGRTYLAGVISPRFLSMSAFACRHIAAVAADILRLTFKLDSTPSTNFHVSNYERVMPLLVDRSDAGVRALVRYLVSRLRITETSASAAGASTAGAPTAAASGSGVILDVKGGIAPEATWMPSKAAGTKVMFELPLDGNGEVDARSIEAVVAAAAPGRGKCGYIGVVMKGAAYEGRSEASYHNGSARLTMGGLTLPARRGRCGGYLPALPQLGQDDLHELRRLQLRACHAPARW